MIRELEGLRQRVEKGARERREDKRLALGVAREADEAAAEEGADARDDDFNATAACATRDATLWIAFKARAVAASELSFYAKQVTRKRKEGDRQG